MSAADIPQSHAGALPAGPAETQGLRAEEVAAFLGVLDQELTAVEEALRRLDAGTYGLCSVCDGAVSKEELAADPLVQRCPQHR